MYVVSHGTCLSYQNRDITSVHLFLCYTTLQLVIAGRIIAELNLNKNCIEVLYISKIDNLACQNAMNEIRELASSVRFVHMKYKYPLYFPRLYNLFSGRSFKSVYVASVDNILMHYVLSRIKFKELYTFDDGTANIFPESIYYQQFKDNFASHVIRVFLNIQYTMKCIKLKSIKHYTIYKGYKNIVPRLVPINLISETSKEKTNFLDNNHQVCNIFLGGIISDILQSDADIPSFVTKCESFLNDSGSDVIFIPHPRSKEEYFLHNSNWNILQPTHIAEIEIINLLQKYEKVNLFGFLSSCQLNLQAIERIDNHIFYSDKQSGIFKNAIKKFCSINPADFKIINLDE